MYFQNAKNYTIFFRFPFSFFYSLHPQVLKSFVFAESNCTTQPETAVKIRTSFSIHTKICVYFSTAHHYHGAQTKLPFGDPHKNKYCQNAHCVMYL
ncbi:MAG: hypothetical protein A3F54_03720 [Candidatus Kerfeldbacteria bacterium RIFCSPHIGHO2_12_FULL_48_17]|uniref:Uncharacterized protein n=1 Tax=Candidatus Kerfeldbacteria bacterium RIFCSPHIGHO2_12_FULL_48_17 TaxID=1798542 RepID=A0A1G2AYL4_9BACT|nr:MAG: hypothetical protein A3F54_03720 [Candidatus Kerfeldbacteria bacterium RIFCSPHIGHO2_12_FULL_48_17]